MEQKRMPWFDRYKPIAVRPTPEGCTIIVAPNTISPEDIQRIVDVLTGRHKKLKS